MSLLAHQFGLQYVDTSSQSCAIGTVLIDVRLLPCSTLPNVFMTCNRLKFKCTIEV